MTYLLLRMIVGKKVAVSQYINHTKTRKVDLPSTESRGFGKELYGPGWCGSGG